MRRSLLIAVAAMSISACASAQPPTPPVAITSHAVSQADYPPEALKLGEQGATSLSYVVLEDGSVGDIQVLKSSGFSRLDQGAETMVKSRWRFKPAMRNGRPVREALTAEIVFALSPTSASYVIVAPEHIPTETEATPADQEFIAQIHRIYREVEQKQAALTPPKDDAERLVRMGEVDQAVRYWISISHHRPPATQAEWAEISQHDLANQALLKAMLPPEGWFLKSRYGQDAIQAALDIVYHAVNDRQLQRSVLAAIEPLIAKGEIRARGYAMLYDRIAVEDGRPQRYGSVIICREHKPVLAPLEDPAHVDLWRTTLEFPLTAEQGVAEIASVLPCS